MRDLSSFFFCSSAHRSERFSTRRSNFLRTHHPRHPFPLHPRLSHNTTATVTLVVVINSRLAPARSSTKPRPCTSNQHHPCPIPVVLAVQVALWTFLCDGHAAEVPIWPVRRSLDLWEVELGTVGEVAVAATATFELDPGGMCEWAGVRWGDLDWRAHQVWPHRSDR